MPCRRVTLRCIAEDLTSGGTSRAQRRAQDLRELLGRHARGSASDADVAAFLRIVPPLGDVDHPLVRAFVESDGLVETLAATSVATPAGRVSGFSVGHWHGTVLLTEDATTGAHAHGGASREAGDSVGSGDRLVAGPATVAWLVAARPGGERTASDAEADVPPGDADLDALAPQASDLVVARVERAMDRREEWKSDVDRMTRSLLTEAIGTGDAGPVPIAAPAGGDEPLFELTLSLERPDADEPAQVIVVIVPGSSAAEAALRVGTRTVLAAIAPEAVAWTAGALPAGAMTYAASLPDCTPSASVPEGGRPGRIVVGSFAHYAPTAGLTEATLAGTPVQALCGHWFVPMHDHLSRPTCERCAALRDTLA